MSKRFKVHKLFLAMSTAGILTLSHQVFAAAFQLWELDAVSIGNYHAGHAAVAEDASTSFHNPAGLIRIKNQEIILGGSAILTDFAFRGTVAVNTLLDKTPHAVVAQGGGFNFVPFLHYAAPISEQVAFGFSVVVPFGLKTNYGDDTAVRYSAMLSSIKVIDYTPSLAFALNNKFSVGFGLDIQHMEGEFNQTATANATNTTFDTISRNSGSDNAYGYHLGVLYQPTEDTRVGLGYHSQVVHHLKGKSTFTGPLANQVMGGTQTSNQLRANVTLPPITSLSAFHRINSAWDILGSISYVQWNVLQQLTLQNTAGMVNMTSTNSLPITINQNYHDAWNYTIGTNYHLNDQVTLRGGIGYDQTPSNNRDRNLQLPDSDRVAVSLGGHYQATKTISFDLGWTHVFAKPTRINNLSQQVGDEIVVTDGPVNSSADVYALQLKWDIA